MSQVNTRQPGFAASSPILTALAIGLGIPLLALAAGGRALVHVDGMALVACSLTLFVGAVIVAFSARYMRSDRQRSGYFVTVGLLLGCVNLFALSGNMLVLAGAWIASGSLLARLIGHDRSWVEATAAAARARRAFLIGDAALLAAALLLVGQTGTVQVAAILATAGSLPSWIVGTAAFLLLIAATVRCALPPLSGWLLSSMTAPTPVSALMHAGLVNAGGFLLIRFAPVMEAAPAVRAVAIALGLFAALYGLGIMMVRPDVKRSLAGSTVSQMGFMIMSCGIGAYAAALWHLVAHGLFKAWLFLGAGSAVGIRASGKVAGEIEPKTTAGIAGSTLMVGAGLALSGRHAASLVPLLLGGATATATLIAALRAEAPLWSKGTLVVGLAALAASHVFGLGLAEAAVGADGPPLLSTGPLLAILAVFLGGWVWQQHRLNGPGALPLPLYVHLLNAGAIRAPLKGEA